MVIPAKTISPLIKSQNNNPMNDQRNQKGHFTKGHGGFKPKGAINVKTRLEQTRIKELVDILDQHLEEDILNLDRKERIKLWLTLSKLLREENPNQPESDAESEQITKIIFQVVPSSKS